MSRAPVVLGTVVGIMGPALLGCPSNGPAKGISDGATPSVVVAEAGAPSVTSGGVEDAGAGDASASADAAHTSVSSAAPHVAIGMADNGKTVTAKKGEEIVLSLPANPTTGFDWTLTLVDKTLGQPTIDFASSTTDPNIAGAGGVRTFTWSGTSALDLRGTHVVELAYKRSWETTPPARTFKVTIKITD